MEHGSGTQRTETNASEPVLLGFLFISLVSGAAHLTDRHVSFPWFAGRTCNCGVEIVWRFAAGAGDGGGTLDSKTSIGGLHQYRHRAFGIRCPFQLPSGKTGNAAYLLILIVLGFGEAWTLVALALDLRDWIVAR